MDAPAIVVLEAARIDELRDLWLALHRAHGANSAVPLQPDDELRSTSARATQRCTRSPSLRPSAGKGPAGDFSMQSIES